MKTRTEILVETMIAAVQGIATAKVSMLDGEAIANYAYEYAKATVEKLEKENILPKQSDSKIDRILEAAKN